MRYFKLLPPNYDHSGEFSIWETNDKKSRERRVYNSIDVWDDNWGWDDYAVPHAYAKEIQLTEEEYFIEMI